MITVIITTYKRNSEIVSRAIDSVINQTYSDWELFVVDDSPKTYEGRYDVEKKVLSYNNKKIKYIKLEKNMGACAARNKGIKLASGDYIAFLDDDDVWKNDKLEKQLNKFKDLDERYGLIYCGSVYYNTKNKSYKEHKTIYKSGKVFDDLIVKNFIGGSSFPLIRTSVIKELDGFDEELLAAQDLDMWLRISRNYLVDYVKEPLVIYYQNEGEQISTSPHKRLQGMQKKIEKNITYLENHPKQYGLCLLDLSYATAMNKDYYGAVALLKKAKKTYKYKTLFLLKAYLRIVRYYLKYKNK